jgi:hypothetical protein
MLSVTVVQKVHGRIRKEIEPFVVRSDTESEADDGKGEACAKWRYYGDRIAQSPERHLSIVRGLEAPRISTPTATQLNNAIPTLINPLVTAFGCGRCRGNFIMEF